MDIHKDEMRQRLLSWFMGAVSKTAFGFQEEKARCMDEGHVQSETGL